MEGQVIAELDIHDELDLTDYRRKILAQWLMKVASEVLDAIHEPNTMLVLHDDAE